MPKKYVEKVGDEGFKKAPIGAGPYKFVSFKPGVELVLEAFDRYWRKPPSVKRLVLKVIPDETTRLAALKRGEVDIAYSIRGELAEELQRTPGLTLKPAVVQASFYIYFPDQWDPKSPWHDERVRRAASLAIDREGINQAMTLGYSLVTGNPIVPDHLRILLAAAGAGLRPAKRPSNCWPRRASRRASTPAIITATRPTRISARPCSTICGESASACKLRPIERAAFIKGYAEKKFKNMIQAGRGAFGNAATRLEAYVVKGGAFVYGSYPDIDELLPSSRRSSSTTKSARRSCTRCSSSFTSGRSTRRSGSWPSSTASDRGSASRGSG